MRKFRELFIDWGAQLLVPDYPPYPNLQTALDHVGADLSSVTTDFRGRFERLVIASVTPPGSSGGLFSASESW